MRAAQIFDFTWSTAPSGATGGTGVWNFPTPRGFRMFHGLLIGGGGGGGAGARCASATIGGGGQGGQSGGWFLFRGGMDLLAAANSLDITIGDGGAGAPGIAVDSTDGARGSNGGVTKIVCNGVVIFEVNGGRGGLGGANAGSTFVTPAGPAADHGGQGEFLTQQFFRTFSLPGCPIMGSHGPGWGGNSNPYTSSNSATGKPGCTGGGSTGTLAAGGTGGGTNSATNGGAGGANTSIFPFSGGGGGGGGHSASVGAGTVGVGGAGGLYGGGGGGGSRSLNGSLSGAGGAGARGFLRLYML